MNPYRESPERTKPPLYRILAVTVRGKLRYYAQKRVKFLWLFPVWITLDWWLQKDRAMYDITIDRQRLEAPHVVYEATE